jgi:hypothetical protein
VTLKSKSAIKIISGRGKGIDPINRMIKIFLRLNDMQLNEQIYESISNQLSFFFLGIIFDFLLNQEYSS